MRPVNRYLPLASVVLVWIMGPDGGQAPAYRFIVTPDSPSSVASCVPLPFQSRKTVSPIWPPATVRQASEPVPSGTLFWVVRNELQYVPGATFAPTWAVNTRTRSWPALMAEGTEKTGWLGLAALTVVAPVRLAPLTVTLSLLT